MLILVLNLLTRIKFGHHTCCAGHAPGLCVGGTNGKRSLNFWIPMVWREPTNHVTDCYFCAVDVTGINRKNRGSLRSPDLQSARCPVAHCDEIPVPIFGDLADISDEDASDIRTKKWFLKMMLHTHFPKRSSRPQLVNGLCRTVGIQIEGKKPSSLTLLASVFFSLQWWTWCNVQILQSFC